MDSFLIKLLEYWRNRMNVGSYLLGVGWRVAPVASRSRGPEITIVSIEVAVEFQAIFHCYSTSGALNFCFHGIGWNSRRILRK